MASKSYRTEAPQSRRILFESNGTRLVGDLYLPPGYDGSTPLPGVIVTGAWTTVKEQMPRRYAAEMAQRGFAALAFDFRGWGQSEGDVRQYEHPAMKTADIVAAAEALSTCPEVDPARIAGLGICASSGYMSAAASLSSNIKVLALVAPWLHNAEIVDAVYGGAGGVAQLIAAGRAAVEAYAETGHQTMVPAASLTDRKAVMYQAPYYTEKDRGLIPEYDNRFYVGSWEPWLTFDAVATAAALAEKPVQIVHSEAAAIPQGAHAFFDRLTGSKSELWLQNVSQFDFYDQDGPVAAASDTVAAFFKNTLGEDHGSAS